MMPTKTLIQLFQELEQEILKELGFGNKPEAVPVSQAAVAAPVAPIAPNGNGANPKPALPQSAPNGKRAMSWGTAQVEALLKAKLAANPVEAVHMLNESGLTQDANPQQVVEHFKK